jgi:hypothetical protein
MQQHIDKANTTWYSESHPIIGGMLIFVNNQESSILIFIE